jgi:hypothetical protein
MVKFDGAQGSGPRQSVSGDAISARWFRNFDHPAKQLNMGLSWPLFPFSDSPPKAVQPIIQSAYTALAQDQENLG